MIAHRQITITDDTIPIFAYKGKNYYLAIEDYKKLLAASLPMREHVEHHNGDQVKKHWYQPEESDLTVDDIKKYIIAHLDDWREEEEQ